MNLEQITAEIDEALQDLPLAERVDTINEIGRASCRERV